MNETCK